MNGLVNAPCFSKEIEMCPRTCNSLLALLYMGETV